MNEAQRTPVDYDALKKGDVIPAARIEQIVGVTRASPNYAFRMLRLKGQIERELADRGKVWTIASANGDLRVLTDAEASTYNFTEAAHARSKERRCFARQAAVEVDKLPADERPEHERRLYIQSRFIQAAAAVREELKLEPARRAVPGLPKAE